MATLTADPREARQQGANYQPSDEDRKALELLDRCFITDDRVRLANEAQWSLNLAYLRGHQYLQFDHSTRQLVYSQTPSLQWRARSVHNLIRPSVRQAAATVGNFRPRYKVRPSSNDPEDLAASNVGERVLSHYWDLLRMPAKKWEAIYSLKVFGNVFFKVIFDPQSGEAIYENQTIETPDGPVEVEDRMFEGDIDSSIVLPYHIFIDNYIESPEDLWWLIEARARPIEWVEQHFPDKAAMVPPGLNQLERFRSGMWLSQPNLAAGRDSVTRKNWVFVREYWAKPTLDYPRGRLVIDANNVILVNSNNPTPKNRLPYVWLRDEPVPGEAWAQCDVDNQITLQRDYNRLQSKRLEHVVYTANAKLLEHAQNELPESAVTSEIGERVKWNGITPPSWLIPPPLPNDLGEHEGSIIQGFDRTSSTFGAERGQYQGKVSGKAYISLIEQGMAAKTPVIERLADAFSDWGKLVLEWVQSYVTEDRLVKVMGRDQQFDVMEFKGADLRGNTDVTIDVDSMTPKSKALGLELLMTLAPGQPWLNAADPDDRTRVWRMLGMEDDTKLVADKRKDERQAAMENHSLLLGDASVAPAAPWEDHDVHVLIHNEARKGDEYKKAPPIIRMLFDAHVQSHLQIAMPVAGVTVPLGMQGPPQEETAMEGPEKKPRSGGNQRQSPPPQQNQGMQPLS